MMSFVTVAVEERQSIRPSFELQCYPSGCFRTGCEGKDLDMSVSK